MTVWNEKRYIIIKKDVMIKAMLYIDIKMKSD